MAGSYFRTIRIPAHRLMPAASHQDLNVNRFSWALPWAAAPLSPSVFLYATHISWARPEKDDMVLSFASTTLRTDSSKSHCTGTVRSVIVGIRSLNGIPSWSFSFDDHAACLWIFPELNRSPLSLGGLATFGLEIEGATAQDPLLMS